MNKAISFLCILIILFSLIACASEPRSEDELQAIEFKNLLLSTNNDFYVAGDDLIVTIEEDVSMIYIFSEEVRDSVISSELLRTQTMLKNRITPLREFEDTDINFEDEIVGTVAGQQAFVNSFYGMIDDISWFTNILTFNDSKYFYTVIFVCRPDSENLSEYVDEFSDIIESIKLTITPTTLK